MLLWNAAKSRAELFTPVPPSLAAPVFNPLGHVSGNKLAVYAVVEFGDYQCPPCRQMALTVKAMAIAGKHGFAFEFRNNPLVSLHPLAVEAATISEAVPADKFWEVHDMLYEKQPEFSREFFSSLKKTLDISGHDLTAASTIVNSDERVAEALALTYTPAFFLLTPRGKVYKVKDLSLVPAMIDADS